VQGDFLAIQPGLGQELDCVSQFLGEPQVHGMQLGDPKALDPVHRDRHAERDLGQDRQLVGRVAPIDVERWVRLGVPEPLGFRERVRVAHTSVGHGRQDEVAGPIQDALDGGDLVGSQALGERANDWDAAGHAGLEPDRPLVLPGRFEHLGPVLGEQGLIRGHDVLAGRQCIQHHLLRDPGPADQFYHDVDLWVVDRGRDVGRNEFTRDVRPGLARVADDDVLQVDRPAGPGGDTVGVFEKDTRHTAANGPAADEGNVERVCHMASTLEAVRRMNMSPGGNDQMR